MSCVRNLEQCMGMQAVLAAEAPTGSNKYDMVGATLAAGLAAEASAPADGPVAGALDWLLSVVGIDYSPTGVSRGSIVV